VFCGTLAKVPSQCTDELWESNFSRVGVVKPIILFGSPLPVSMRLKVSVLLMNWRVVNCSGMSNDKLFGKGIWMAPDLVLALDMTLRRVFWFGATAKLSCDRLLYCAIIFRTGTFSIACFFAEWMNFKTSSLP